MWPQWQQERLRNKRLYLLPFWLFNFVCLLTSIFDIILYSINIMLQLRFFVAIFNMYIIILLFKSGVKKSLVVMK